MATIAHSKSCELSEKPITESFKSRTVIYCPECSKYTFDEVKCEHEYFPVRFVLSNGAIQVRMLCNKCWSITPKSEPHAQFNMDLLPCKKMESYREFIDSRYAAENEKVKEFTDALCIKADEFNKKEYHAYLGSDMWRKKRDEVMKRDNYTCQICGIQAQNVHHLSYIHRGSEYMFELVSLCVKCHEEYHAKEAQFEFNYKT